MRRILLFLLAVSGGNIMAQINYADFEGEKSSICFLKQYRLANLYDYSDNTKTGDSVVVKAYGYEIAEEALTRKYYELLNTNTADSISSRIILKWRLLLEIDNEKHTFIKYKLNAPANGQSNFVANLVFRNGRWEENNDQNREIESIKYVVTICKRELLFAFFRERDDPNHPEVNKLKAFVKNETGVLDLKLMESIIKQNRKQLEEYLD